MVEQGRFLREQIERKWTLGDIHRHNFSDSLFLKKNNLWTSSFALQMLRAHGSDACTFFFLHDFTPRGPSRGAMIAFTCTAYSD